jgi:2',3'-cyclic-nucleotide 2'-phosphodiesterase / 3'-nucleotidase / 5'-nucleotidase
MSGKFARFIVALFVIGAVFVVPASTQEAVATTDIAFSSYFARVQPNPMYQILNRAAVAFGREKLKGTEYEGLPVLSRQSITHGGFRGAGDFLTIPAGKLTMDDVNKIYRYSNTVQALKLNGKQIVEWLEASGGNFNQIDPEKAEDQLLINYGFDGHHLDHFWDITYQYDVTKPKGSRVVYAHYQGRPLSEDMHFIIMSDNYRAGGGGGLPNAVPANIVAKWDVNFRTVVADYLKSVSGNMPGLVINWSIKPVATKGKVLVKTGAEWGVPVMEYMELAAEKNLEPVAHFEYFGTDDVWGLFEIDLSKVPTP